MKLEKNRTPKERSILDEAFVSLARMSGNPVYACVIMQKILAVLILYGAQAGHGEN